MSLPHRLLRAALALLLLVALAALAPLAAAPAHAAEAPVPIASDRETVPGAHTGDSMDDPAIWVHPTDPSRSLVIVNDKAGSLDTYDLDGTLRAAHRGERALLGQRRRPSGRDGRWPDP